MTAPVDEPGISAAPEMGIPVATTASAPPRAPAATGARRVASSARRAPAVTFSYAYLSHDIRYLGLLAPAMVVLLILADIFLH